MKISDAKQFIKNLASKNVHIPPLIVGSMGVGKSAIVKQVAIELYGVDEKGDPKGFCDLRLATQEPGDLIGIPRVVNGKTVWAEPSWWPQPDTKGILFLDEMNRAPVDVRQGVFQLVKDRILHTHKLPVGWTIVSAINPDSSMGNGNYQVEQLDPAMLRRFCVLKVTSDVETWLAWAKGPGEVDPAITGFISAHRQCLALSEEFELKVKPTQDQYAMLSVLWKSGVIMKEVEQEVFSGLLGPEAAVAFRKYLDNKFDRPVSGKDVLSNYSKVQAKLKKQPNPETYSTLTDLVAELEVLKKLSKQEVENIYTMFLDLTAESQATFASKIPQHFLAEFVMYKDFSDVMTRLAKQRNN